MIMIIIIIKFLIYVSSQTYLASDNFTYAHETSDVYLERVTSRTLPILMMSITVSDDAFY